MQHRAIVSLVVTATVLACGIGGMQDNAMLSSVDIEPQDAPPIVLGAGFHTLSGHVHASSVEIGPEARVLVSSNLILDSIGPIVVHGVLELANGSNARADAPSLTLLSNTAVMIHGKVFAGNGFDAIATGLRGGHGSMIHIETPYLQVDSSELRGGDGGQGGPAAIGGSGGSLVIFASLFVTTNPEFVGYGGNGGNGGIGVAQKNGLQLPGGTGGRGGDAVVHALPPEDLHAADIQSLWQRANEGAHGDDLTGDAGNVGVPDNAPCEKGGAGGPGQPMVAGAGGNGGAGANGQSDGTPPTNGGDGGRGGHGTGGMGGRGGHGGTCCPGGVCGGNGGAGGKGSGGPAGKGGKGGNAFHDGAGYTAPGGHGGSGGVGGNGQGGHGGAGGNNGAGTPQCVLRAVGGAKGGSKNGKGGTGGERGLGNPHGNTGPSGGHGTANDGLAGPGGAPAEPCSEN